MHRFLLAVAIVCCFSFGVSLKKRISDTDFRYEFYTTDKVVKPNAERHYYWFKGGRIHNSEYGVGGELLHGDFLKYYHSNQLAEAGEFKNGIKKGCWKTWFENGVLQSKAYWSNGQLDGSYYGYDKSGKLLEKGHYKNNKKHGRWTNYENGEVVKYRNGELVVKKVKEKDTLSKENKKPGLIKRLFSKKEKPAEPEVKEGQKVTQKSSKVKESKQEDSPNFFQRLFTKKEKQNTEGQKVKSNKGKTGNSAKSKDKDGNKDNFFKRIFSKKDKKAN